ncbi:MAG: hypothetical protein J7L88_01005 [Thermoplasmata archaeon]|nr:hypothetical protein [Thermoplasmata archaeon]
MHEEMYPICGACEKGRLLPFYGPNGTVVYFCTHCMRKFSGYTEEPVVDGIPVFSNMAHYSEPEERVEESVEESPLIDEYERIFLKYLPDIIEEGEVYCPFCEIPMEKKGVIYVCSECGYRD